MKVLAGMQDIFVLPKKQQTELSLPFTGQVANTETPKAFFMEHLQMQKLLFLAVICGRKPKYFSFMA